MLIVNNYSVLYSILIVIVLILIAAVITAIYLASYVLPDMGFKLPEKLTEKEVHARIRSLSGADERGSANRDLILAEKYCKCAYTIVIEKNKSGKILSDFERIFAENYLLYLSAVAEIRPALKSIYRLPQRREGGILAFADVVASGLGLISDRSAVAACVGILSSKHRLTWEEIVALKPAFRLALIKQLAVYASKIVFRDKMRVRAVTDSRKGKPSAEYCSNASYVRVYSEICSSSTANELSAAYGMDVYAASSIDDNMLAEYSAGITMLFDELRKNIFTDKFFISLSPAAEVYYTRDCGFENLSERTQKEFLVLNSKIAAKKKIDEVEAAEMICDCAKMTGSDISEYLMPKYSRDRLTARILISVTCAAIFSIITALINVSVGSIICSVLLFPIIFLSVNTLYLYIAGRILPSPPVPELAEDKFSMPHTAIVICVAVKNKITLIEAYRHLMTMACAARNAAFSYGLIVDCIGKDYTSEQAEKDVREILKHERTFIFLRKKPVDRKRGAICDFNSVLLGGKIENVVISGTLPECKYVITLDSDTALVDADRLVAIMEHPYNAKFAVMALNMRSYLSKLTTPFSRLMCGNAGVSHYDCNSDALRKLHGYTCYTGKGIYRVQKFSELTGTALPKGRILSHDFIEGELAGCGWSGVSALEEYPHTSAAYYSRAERWMRGDIQNIPYLRRNSPDMFGNSRRRKISPVALFLAVDNLLRILHPQLSVCIIIMSLILRMPAFALFAITPEILMTALSLSAMFVNTKEALRGAAQALVTIAYLPHTAFVSMKATIIAVIRLITGKNLLEWTTYSPIKVKRPLMLSSLVVGILCAVLFALRPDVISLIFALIFLSALPADLLLSVEDKAKAIDKNSALYWRNISVKTWKYFEHALITADYLPPDNYSENCGWAMRTSPTDIGMTLSAAICAADMSVITECERDRVIGKVLKRLTELKKYRGCPYNWYDTRGNVLKPAYVSSVDCGNLIAALVHVMSVGGENASVAERLIDAMDLSFLKDKNAVRIGYNTESNEADKGRYDLLASESTLTYLMMYACGKAQKDGYYELSRMCLKGKHSALASWTGGVFEYMLPLIYLPAPKGSLLARSAEGAAAEHADYASRRSSPVCGASESLYGEKYANGDNKYMAFGAPSIALAPYSGKDVFAPYAAVMLTAVGSAYANPDGLDEFLSEIGLYDSIDMTTNTVQRACMTHHQGMIMLSVCNMLAPGSTKNRMNMHPGVRAACLLMEEEPSSLKGAVKQRKARLKDREQEFVRVPERNRMPDIDMLTDGNYRLIINEHGRNAQLCGGIYLSRFDDMQGLTLHALIGKKPEREITVDSECIREYGSSRFLSEYFGIFFETEATVLAGKNAEIRRIKCKNTTNNAAIMSVIARIIPGITYRETDLAHKTFSRMFIQTAKNDKFDYAYARRRDTDESVGLYCSLPASYCGDERCARSGKSPSFGMTTEGFLSARTEFVLAPGEEKTIDFILACGNKDALDEMGMLCKDRGAVEYMLLYGREIAHKNRIPAIYREVASELIFGGKVCGAPKQLTLVVSENTLSYAVSAVRYLGEAARYGAVCSITILNRIPASYSSNALTELMDAVAGSGGICRICDISSGMTDEAAQVLAAGTDVRAIRNKVLLPFHAISPLECKRKALPVRRMETELGIGGFCHDCGYFIDAATPSPWYNVMSDGTIGCLTSDNGEFTFASNARENKFTRHSCDELNDIPGDGVAFAEGDLLWSTSRTAISANCAYTTYHGFGYSEYKCGCNELEITRRVFIESGIKYSVIDIDNRSNRLRSLDIMYFAELVMGDIKQRTAGGIKGGEYNGGIYAVCGELSLYLTASIPAESVSHYAESYRDTAGRIRTCSRLGNNGITPALAYACKLKIPSEKTVRITFALSGRPILITDSKAENAFVRVLSKFKHISLAESDEIPFRYYLKWLHYQTYIARFTAKCGFQQPGGATGFRDALQDASALLGTHAVEVRKFIIRCAGHQFEAGDVMHWWHEPATGVRTHICDDKLFLPVAVADYVEYTGDSSLLDEFAPYLENTPIPNGQQSVYGPMTESSIIGTIREHVMRAFDSVKLSSRGLVLIGSGDWNDGMDRLGIEGKGESVWCSMFAYYSAGRFIRYAKDEDRARLADLRRRLREGVASCRLSDRYIRAFDDDGKPIGTEECDECKIDLLVSAWAVLSGIESGDDARQILTTAYGKLYDPENKIIKLLDPPFIDKRVGYIAEYPAGVRENGGQYTHAAVWFIRALYEAGMDELAEKLLIELLPISHTSDLNGVEKYLKEPYVMAGDVYSGALAGRGGWTWYTGAAGWMYRTIIEYHYGIRISEDRVTFRPRMVKGHAEITVNSRCGSFTFDIISEGTGETSIHINGAEYTSDTFKISSLQNKKITIHRSKR